MPIDFREYHPKWKAISRFIRHYRAKDRCEWCGKKNGEIWLKHPDLPGEALQAPTLLVDCFVRWKGYKATKIVLTVAHLDHDKTNNSFFNLAALCQACHLGHDRKQHALNRRYGRNWERDQLKLDI